MMVRVVALPRRQAPAGDPLGIAAIIIARMGSSRLPGKALMPISGRPMFDFLVERVRGSRTVKRIILATSERQEDEQLAEHGVARGVEVFRGPSEDVLGRLASAASTLSVDPVVELLGDSPLVDGELIDDVVDFFYSDDYDYVANVTREYPHAPKELKRFPVGIRVQVMTGNTLARCEQMATEPSHREHSTSFIYENPGLFRIGYFEAIGKWANLNWPEGFLAINHKEDLDCLSALVERTLLVDSSLSLRSLARPE